MIITIDGPTASGKSSVARMLAADLGYLYLNTGFLYRSIAYILLNDRGYVLSSLSCPQDKDISDFTDKVILYYSYHPESGASVFYKNNDITSYLKSSSIDQAASTISACKNVRDLVLRLQKRIADSNNVIAEGRDCGTTVFPDAQYKFFLTADLDVRVDRWHADQVRRNNNLSRQEAQTQLVARDHRDTTRKLAPLVIAPGAHVIDNSRLTPEQTVALMKSYLKF